MSANEICTTLELNAPEREDWHALARKIEATIDRKIRARAPDLGVETLNGRVNLTVPLDLDGDEVRRLRHSPGVGVWLQQRYADGVLVELDGAHPAAFLQVTRR